MRHLVIGQRQKAPNFSAFHWSPHGCLITIGQHFVTTRVVHLPKRTETSLITESEQSRANHQLLLLCTVRTAWSDSDQAVRVVHSCKSWFASQIGSFLTGPNTFYCGFSYGVRRYSFWFSYPTCSDTFLTYGTEFVLFYRCWKILSGPWAETAHTRR